MIRDDSLALLGSLVVVVFFGGPVLLWAANQGVLLPSAIGMLSRLATGLRTPDMVTVEAGLAVGF